MIGTRPTISLPLLSDTLSTIVSKTSASLDAIADSIADKASPSALNLNADLSLSGNRAIDVGGLILVDGNNPSGVGALYYHNGEFYAVDSTGTIQITKLGQLNSSAIGGIGGDYGGTNPALVSYNNANQEYRFYADPGVPTWAGLAAKYITLEGTSGTVKVGVDAALSGNETVNFKSLPSGSHVGFLAYDATNTAIIDGSTATYDQGFTTTGDIKAAHLKFSGARQVIVPACQAVKGQTTTAAPSYGATYKEIKKWGWTNDGNTDVLIYPVSVPVGAQFTSYGARIDKTSGTTGHIHVVLVKIDTDTESNPDAGNASGIDYNVNNPGNVTISPTNAVDTGTVGQTEQYQLVVYTSGNISDFIYWAYYSYIMP